MGPDCRRRRPCWQKMREGGLAIHGLGRIPGPRRTCDLRFCHDATYHERPIAPFATNGGLQSGPLVAFPDTRAQKQRNQNARQPASKQQPASGIQNEAEAWPRTPDIQNAARSNHTRQAFKMRLKRNHARQASKKQASQGGVVRKRWHHKCAIGRQSRTRRCATMNELLRGQECLRMRRAASVPQ